MKNQNAFVDPTVAVVVAGVGVFAALIFIGGPQYNVWQQSLAGKAELLPDEYILPFAILLYQREIVATHYIVGHQ